MNQLLNSTIKLQGDIQECLPLLVNARLNHDNAKEAEALCKMEILIVDTAQQLQCVIDEFNTPKN